MKKLSRATTYPAMKKRCDNHLIPKSGFKGQKESFEKLKLKKMPAFRQLDSEVVEKLRKLDHGKSLSYYTRNIFCSESNLSISFDPKRVTVTSQNDDPNTSLIRVEKKVAEVFDKVLGKVDHILDPSSENARKLAVIKSNLACRLKQDKS